MEENHILRIPQTVHRCSFLKVINYIAEHFSPDEIESVTYYEDDGWIRSDMDRPDLNRLKDDILAGLINVVVIYKIDRLCCDMADFVPFYAFLKDHGVKFITIKDGIDTTTPIGEAMMYLAVIFSGLEVQTDSLRITDNMNHLAAEGFWCGGKPPIGYDIQEISLGAKSHKPLFSMRMKSDIKTLSLIFSWKTISPFRVWRPTAKTDGSPPSKEVSSPPLSSIVCLALPCAWPTLLLCMIILRIKDAR